MAVLIGTHLLGAGGTPHGIAQKEGETMIIEIFSIIFIFASAYLFYIWSLECMEKKKRMQK